MDLFHHTPLGRTKDREGDWKNEVTMPKNGKKVQMEEMTELWQVCGDFANQSS